ncbi:MAG TPA: hypothetical protein VHK67_03110 [Rhabdochlamydiaceae bacterium]|jgi:uncharacterized metal-binding protein YceD (DUF177 family)|nr:hypothetical protein [Rhabdochlamydiaceae bacterium]
MELKVFTEQLRDGKRETFEHVLPPDFLGINEPDIVFHHPIHVKGEVYATDEDLILQLSAHTEVQMPCSICNQMTFVPLKTEELYHTILLDDSTTFDFSDILREELIILIPQYVECHNGKCPERQIVSKFMKNKAVSPQNHFPFADL